MIIHTFLKPWLNLKNKMESLSLFNWSKLGFKSATDHKMKENDNSSEKKSKVIFWITRRPLKSEILSAPKQISYDNFSRLEHQNFSTFQFNWRLALRNWMCFLKKVCPGSKLSNLEEWAKIIQKKNEMFENGHFSAFDWTFRVTFKN